VIEKMDIGWLYLEGGIRAMAYIESIDDDTKYRVNYCPSCGKYIRDLINPPQGNGDDEV
jgi:hypothetical protein